MNSDDSQPPSPERSMDFKAGEVLLIDKPLDWTSFDIVNKIRYRLRKVLGIKKIKVGHAGTLDPLATGLLIICTGKATKTIHEYQGMEKVYTGTVRLGGSTASFDTETEVDQEYPFDHITLEQVEQVIQEQFMGEIEQVPPVFSAIKVDGVPLYKKARKGQQVDIKSRKVIIYDFQITRFELPEMDFKITCSKGTYIRSIANDIGLALNSGGHLAALRRTHIGQYAVDDAFEIESFCNWLEHEYVPLPDSNQ
jgi:tRNA pseudouridine55 synthase